MQLNRRVLSWDLKDASDWLLLISGGSRFHASGADMAKEPRPKSVACSWDDNEVTVCGRSQSASATDRWQVGRSLLDIVVQDHVKPCRLANKACTVSVVELAASEVDHAAHDWCHRTCSVHRWVVPRCSSLLAADSVDIALLQSVNSCSSQYVISQNCCLPFLQHPLGVL